MKTRTERNLQQMAQCIYSIPSKCGRSYTGKTGRHLVVQLCEHRHNLKEDHLENSKLAQHAYEEGHAEMKQGFWKLKVTAGTGSTKIQPIWHV
jgi:hypothetical protein